MFTFIVKERGFRNTFDCTITVCGVYLMYIVTANRLIIRLSVFGT